MEHDKKAKILCTIPKNERAAIFKDAASTPAGF
jgi:hypothetical protein